jgi:CheY-like chemotaxis protein
MLSILHLEDDKMDALLIEETVRNAGLQAEFVLASTRSEFISALDKEHFDVVLTDSGLTDFDGLSALKMVRQKYPAVTFICLSGSSEPAKIKANFDSGASDFISKNDLPRLVEVLRREQDRK